MPQLTLLRLLFYWEVLELAYLIFELNDKPDLCRGTEVAHNQEADHLEEAVSAQALFIQSHLAQLFLLDRSDLHDVPYV